MKVLLLMVSLLLLTSHSTAAENQPELSISEQELDVLITQSLTAFNVPGIAVAVIKDNKVVHAKGYGLRNIHSKAKVTSKTLFQIASNSKAMTTAALAILIDEGKISWQDKVVDYLPEFSMSNPYITNEFTIEDLLTHRSGLPLGAGDLLFYPDAENIELSAVFTAISTIKPSSSFRSEFAYDNLLYILAGEIIARVSGISWSEFIEQRIFAPLDMSGCKANHVRVSKSANQATPYTLVNDNLVASPFFNSILTGAAGGVNCSIDDMSKWVLLQLNHGKMINGKQLFSTARHQEMWTPKTIVNADFIGKKPDNIAVKHYALGWVISDRLGKQSIWHTGGLAGMVSIVNLVPEQDLAIIILTNQQNRQSIYGLSELIMQHYFTGNNELSLNNYASTANKSEHDALATMQQLWAERDKNSEVSLPLAELAQTYHDSWFGDVVISLENNTLAFRSKYSPSLTGTLKHFQHNTFIVQWHKRELLADAYLSFILDKKNNITAIKMKAFDPRTDFSFDFHHLNLQPKFSQK